MIVNSEYDKTVGMIDAWNTAEGLGMANDRRDIKGGTAWNAGNSLIIVLAEGAQTRVELDPPEGEQADDRALKTWEKLRALIERPAQSGQNPVTPPGLIEPAIDTARWVALNTTGITKSSDTQEILKDPSRTAEYVERMRRVEKGINAISDMAVPQPSELESREEQKELPAVRARRLGLQSVEKLERWDRIENEFIPQALTQEKMAESAHVSTETIRKDIRQMKTHKSEFPTTWEVYGK